MLEPWEHVVPLQGAEHNYTERKVTRVWGRRRLRLIEGILPFAESVQIYLKGRALPSFYAVQLGGMTFVLGDRPADLVLSGVNNGQNLGDIVNCSGTAAGAREGALQGALGIALSQGIDYVNGIDVDWAVSRRFGRQVVEAIRSRAARGSWFNVNFPHCPPDNVSGIRAVPSQRFSRSPMRYYASENPGKFFVAIPDQPTPVDPSNDMFELAHSNAITVTPMLLQASDIALAAELDGKLML